MIWVTLYLDFVTDLLEELITQNIQNRVIKKFGLLDTLMISNVYKKADIWESLQSLIKASFQDGINIGDESFLQNVVTDLGLDWQVIKKDLNTKRWKKILNDNVEDMYAGNCWGVPSFKITDQDGGNPFYVWGQDRMWLLKEEIFKRLGGSL